MATRKKRKYDSSARTEAADANKQAVLDAAKQLFTRRGLDKVTIAEVAAKAGVAGSTVYALFQSKEGILRALMNASLFGDRFREARDKLEGVTDPHEIMTLTAEIARSIHEGEQAELGLLRGASAFSAALRRTEEEFEALRYDMQKDRLELVRKLGKLPRGLSFEDARRLMWMHTSRDVYRMLVQVGGWSGERYETWLAATLRSSLIAK